MKAIYMDCFAGISGSMLLGAFIQAGVPEAYLRRELSRLHMDGEFRLKITTVQKQGIASVLAVVEVPNETAKNDQLTAAQIYTRLQSSGFSDEIKERTENVFRKFFQAAGKATGILPEMVRVDSAQAVVDLVCITAAIICLKYLEIEKIFVSKLCVGSGFMESSQGKMPVPLPVTAELLKEIPFYAGAVEGEMTSQGGAALVAALAEHGQWEMPSDFRYTIVAYGAGAEELSIPYVLRLYIGEVEQEEYRSKKILIETNIDDLDPQVFEYVCEELYSLGAIDVWITPVLMKKMRPAQKLSVLADNGNCQKCITLIFRETTSTGLRITEVDRVAVERTMKIVPTPYGGVHCKISRYEGRNIYVAVEYEDCKALARRFKLPLKRIQREALQIANNLYVDGKR